MCQFLSFQATALFLIEVVRSYCGIIRLNIESNPLAEDILGLEPGESKVVDVRRGLFPD